MRRTVAPAPAKDPSLASAPDSLVRLSGVGVVYPPPGHRGSSRPQPVRDVSFEVGEGEVVGVVGRNGAGKTTLLKLLSGIIAPDSGQVWRRPGIRVSMLGLQVGFISTLTGRENAVLSCVLLGMSRRDARASLPRISEFTELGRAMDDPLATYSAGMRARLGFGVAMAASPEVLLIDEVLGVGDAEFQKKSAAMLRSRLAEGRAAVIVSHSLNLHRRLCHRLVVIEGGRSVAVGPVEPVAAEYEKGMVRGPRGARIS